MNIPLHTITLQPWKHGTFGERVACDVCLAALWPLKADDRMTVLISLLASQIEEIAESDDQIDAIVEVLRLQLKLNRRPSPPLQNY